MGYWFIAGPMIGKKEFNFPAFNEADILLFSKRGKAVYNPARRDSEQGFIHRGMKGTYEEIRVQGFDVAKSIGRNAAAIAHQECEGIVLLEGWEGSKLTCVEIGLARALGKKVVLYPSMKPLPNPVESLDKDRGRCRGVWGAVLGEAEAKRITDSVNELDCCDEETMRVHRLAPSMLRVAYRSAMKSPDTSTQNGAVYLAGTRGFTTGTRGHNHPADGSDADYQQTGDKKRYMVHAEVDAITKAAAKGYSTKGGILYAPWSACSACAQVIVNSGISTVVNWKPAMDRTPDRWKEEVEAGLAILRNGGVKVITYNGPIETTAEIMFDGKKWRPGDEGRGQTEPIECCDSECCTATPNERGKLDAIQADRQKVYGDPRENHRMIAMAWAGLLKPHVEAINNVQPIPEWTVALMMASLKNLRMRNVFHQDNYDDARIYLSFAEEWQKGQK